MKPDSPDSWVRAFELFHRVVSLDEVGRTRLLDSSCSGDPELRREVERLLEEDSKQGGLLDRGALPPVSALRPIATPLPARIGAYEVRREIASGGMGTVYEAVQDHPRRTVALKTLRRNLLSENAVRRFRLEGEVLGSLQHPGIAQVYESGTHGADQAPFLAMEYVAEARDLVTSARERGLDLRARIELFLQVCDAVHHGHQRGVIHRDLKPGNVLVDEHGRPKVIDFGLARVTDPERHAVSLAETGAGRVVGTLRYMSPEQLDLSSQRADVLSDVYSLGVILFELLSGEPPHDLEEAGLAQAVARVRDGEPRRLGAVDPRLRGELEWIAGKAMAKERERRYASVHELADDLRRFLRHDPVLAGPPSGTYHLRKFARRHRALLLSVGAVIVALSLGLVRAELEARAARRESERAEQERENAQGVAESLRKTLTAVSPLELGPDATIVEVLEEVAGSVDEDFGDLPEARAMVLNAVGKGYLELRRFDEAEEYLGAAAAFVEANLERDDPLRIDVLAHRAQLLLATHDWPRCEELSRELEPLALASLGPDHEVTLRIQGTLAELLLDTRDLEEAEERYDARIRLLEELRGPEDPELIGARSGRAVVWHRQGRTAAAVAELERVLALAERVLPADNFRVWNARLNLAGCLLGSGRLEDAEEPSRRLLTHCRERFGEAHPLTVAAYSMRAQVLHGRGELEDSLACFEQGLDASIHLFGETDDTTLRIQTAFAAALRDAGDPEYAEVVLREAFENGLESPSELALLGVLTDLWRPLLATERHEEAVEVLSRAYEERRTVGGQDYLQTVLATLVNQLQDLGRAEEAERISREALEFHGPRVSEGGTLLPVLRQLIGTSLAFQGRREEADRVLRAACAEARDGGHDELVRDILVNIAHNLAEMGRFGEAERLYIDERDTVTAGSSREDWATWSDEQLAHLRTEHAPRD